MKLNTNKILDILENKYNELSFDLELFAYQVIGSYNNGTFESEEYKKRFDDLEGERTFVRRLIYKFENNMYDDKDIDCLCVYFDLDLESLVDNSGD